MFGSTFTGEEEYPESLTDFEERMNLTSTPSPLPAAPAPTAPDFDTWWNANQIDPAHTMTVQNAARAAWHAALGSQPVAALPDQAAVDQLAQRLEKMGVTNFGFTPGSNPNATPEQVAAAISGALDQLEHGAALPAEQVPPIPLDIHYWMHRATKAETALVSEKMRCADLAARQAPNNETVMDAANFSVLTFNAKQSGFDSAMEAVLMACAAKGITRLDVMSLIHSQCHRVYASAIDRDEIDTKYMAEIEEALRNLAARQVVAPEAAKEQAVAWAVVSKKGGIHKLSVTRESAERKAASWQEEWPNNGCSVRPLVFGDAPDGPVERDAPPLWFSLRGRLITAAINGEAVAFPASDVEGLLEVFDAAMPPKADADDQEQAS